MSTILEENEILILLKTLPPDKITEVKDFVIFLKSKYSPNIDYSTEWSNEDMRDLTNFSLNYFDQNY